MLSKLSIDHLRSHCFFKEIFHNLLIQFAYFKQKSSRLKLLNKISAKLGLNEFRVSTINFVFDFLVCQET